MELNETTPHPAQESRVGRPAVEQQTCGACFGSGSITLAWDTNLIGEIDCPQCKGKIDGIKKDLLTALRWIDDGDDQEGRDLIVAPMMAKHSLHNTSLVNRPPRFPSDGGFFCV